MKIRKKNIIIATIVIAVIFGMLVKHFVFKPPTSYITSEVTQKDLEEKVLASGTLNAFKTVAVGAQVSGQLKQLHVVLGDRVKAGQLLLVMTQFSAGYTPPL